MSFCFIDYYESWNHCSFPKVGPHWQQYQDTQKSLPGFQKSFHGRESKRNSNKSIPTGPPNHCNFLLNLSGHVADLQGGFDLTPLTYLEHCSTIICNIFFLFSALLQNSWTCLTIPWYPFCQNSSTLIIQCQLKHKRTQHQKTADIGTQILIQIATRHWETTSNRIKLKQWYKHRMWFLTFQGTHHQMLCLHQRH